MPEARSELDYMALQVGTLFVLDERGRLLHSNEPDPPDAPLFFMGRTPAGNIWRFRHDLPDDMAAELDRLCRVEPVVHDFTQPPACYEALRAVLEEFAPLTDESRGPCFRFPAELPDGAPAVELTQAGVDVLPLDWEGMRRDLSLYAPVAAVLDGDRALSVCFSSRIGPHACEAGLETNPAYRRRGYGAAATALWGRLVRERGRIPLYSTEWDNHPSQAVARRLGLVLYGEDFSLI
jgi:RimJ/RimL family protein N-acetyltransferase